MAEILPTHGESRFSGRSPNRKPHALGAFGRGFDMKEGVHKEKCSFFDLQDPALVLSKGSAQGCYQPDGVLLI